MKVEDAAAQSGTAAGSPSKSRLHLKTFVFDREKTFIGSLNLDPRSILQNTEMGVVIKNPELANKIAESALTQLPLIAYQVHLDDGGRIYWQEFDPESGLWIRYDTEPDAGLFRRVFAALSRILPIEKEL